MIAIQKDGRSLKLFQGVSLPWEVEDDMLDFDYLGQAFSYEWEIPRKGNEWVFNFAGAPENPLNGFRTYENFELTVDGHLFWKVNIILKRSSRNVYHIEFTNVPGQLVASKDKSLQSLISTTIAVADGTYADIIQPYNASLQSNVVFPYMHFYDQRPVNGSVINFKNNFMLIPAFKVSYLLKLASATLGYDYIDAFSANGDDLSRLVLIGNRVIDTATSLSSSGSTIGFDKVNNVIDVAEYLPNITFLTFLRQVAITVGASMVINDDAHRIELRGIIREQETSRHVDLTEKIDPEEVISEQADYTSLSFAFDLSQDELLSKTPDSLTGNYRGEFANEAAFAAVSSPQGGDYGFCLTDNTYFRWEQEGATLVLRRYCDALQPTSSDGDSEKKLTLEIIPVSKDKYIYKSQELDLRVIDNGSGKVRLTGFTHFTQIPTGQELRFDESGRDQRVYIDIYYEITATDGVDFEWIDLNLNYAVDVNVPRILDRFLLNYHIPIIGAPLHYPEIGLENTEFKGRFAIWHGMQATIDGLDTYPYASADPYDSQGSKIGSIALRSAQTDNFINRIYDPINKFFRATRILIMQNIHLSKIEMRQLYLVKIGVFSGIKFRLRSISTQIGDNGPQDTEIEGYRL